jgi:signal transduction histidine kinase
VDEEVFRIAQESLQNALLHAHAAEISLRLDEGPAGLTLTVADDGVGFEPGESGLRSRRLGLTSMEERARGLGARLRIESAPGAGTTIGLEVDCDADTRPDS